MKWVVIMACWGDFDSNAHNVGRHIRVCHHWNFQDIKVGTWNPRIIRGAHNSMFSGISLMPAVSGFILPFHANVIVLEFLRRDLEFCILSHFANAFFDFPILCNNDWWRCFLLPLFWEITMHHFSTLPSRRTSLSKAHSPSRKSLTWYLVSSSSSWLRETLFRAL